MRLERIKVSGFKSFKEIDLELRSLNVLIGSNGSGKSNFISLFRMLNWMVTPGLGLQNFIAKNGRAEAFLHYGYVQTKEIFIELSFPNNQYRCTLGVNRLENLYFEHEEGSTDALSFVQGGSQETNLLDDETEVTMETDWPEELKIKFLRAKEETINNLKSIRVFHFHDTSDFAAVKRSSYIYDNKYLRSEGENLAAFLYLLKQEFPKSYESIRSIVQLVAPFFDDFVFQLLPGQDNHVKLDWREKGSDYPFQIFQLSDGALRFICLATVLHLPDEYLPSAILIDEPEMGLHPLALEVLAALIRKAAFRTQVIISTQSVSLVNLFEAEDLLVVERRNRESIIKRLDTEDLKDWLENYSLGDLWEKNVLGGRPSR